MKYPALKDIKIDNHIIGDLQPLFIIAEIGVTCNYDFNMSKELIDVAKTAQANAVKFIFWFPDEILSDLTTTFSYETDSGEKKIENMFDMLSKLVFTKEQWLELKKYADSQNIILFSTINSPSGVKYALDLGLSAFKLSSWDYNFFPLWKELAALKKPLLIDTGPVNTLDVAKVINLVRSAGSYEIALLHCIKTDKYSETNMLAIPYMRHAFSVHVGFSATGQDSTLDIMAVSLGATVLEKRLTLSRKLPGHHHNLSKEPKEFELYVKQMREVQSALGDFTLKPSSKDLEERGKSFRKIVASRAITAGEVITKEMLACKRPETGGVSPEFFDLFIGRRVKCDLKRNQPVLWDDLQ